jgi:16S rRNA C967 or C1407 C5-methylase (RsmB/RsmF family)
MNNNESRFKKLTESLHPLGSFEINKVNPTLCAPYGDDLSVFGFERVEWAPLIWIGNEPLPKDHELFKNNRVFAIGLASVLACLQIDVLRGNKVLDMCAAPGIKSLYLQLLHDKSLDLYVNDISHDRLLRLRHIFEQFQVPLPTFSQQPGQSILNRYKEASFDAVIIDAPCSGEGNIFAGDLRALENWSLSKVKRLSQLQRKLIIAGNKLVKNKGVLIYATCTLNTYENEGAIKKAGCKVDTIEKIEISYQKLQACQAIRIVPSLQSIGFFVAKIK